MRPAIAAVCIIIGYAAACDGEARGTQAGATDQRQKDEAMVNRADLAKRAEETSRQVADLVRRPETEVHQVATPFLVRGSIHHVASRPPLRPMVFTVGTADSDFTVLLGKNPKGFLALASRAGVRLETEPNRISYVTTYLETTCDLTSGFQILRGFDDIRLLNKPKPEERKRYDELRQKYANVIRPPQTSDQDPWTVNLFAVRRRNLVAIRARVQPDGKIDADEKVLEEAIPVPYTK